MTDGIYFAIVVSVQKVLLECILFNVFHCNILGFHVTYHKGVCLLLSLLLHKSFSCALKLIIPAIPIIICCFHILARCLKVGIVTMFLKLCAKTPCGTAVSSWTCPEIFTMFKRNTATLPKQAEVVHSLNIRYRSMPFNHVNIFEKLCL